jgi:EAL domain-containing protein (putative c-di-GMP-specific phosphodiesterase class I)
MSGRMVARGNEATMDVRKPPLHEILYKGAEVAQAGERIKRALEAVRVHLGMEVAYVSEFVDERAVFREVDAPGLEALIKVGDSLSLDDIYCRHILAGRLPQLIGDTSTEAVAMALPITTAVPIAKHVSVPIRLGDGRVYGMFCCLGRQPDRSLNERDLQMMKVFADLAAFEISRDLVAAKALEDKRARILNVIEDDQLSLVYQPIWHVATRRPIGLECLSRISAKPHRGPDRWFKEAAEVGHGTMLELAAVRKALADLPRVPADLYLAVNASPETILSSELAGMLENASAKRIILELTEHAHVDDYARLLGALQPLRQRGIRLAVDDAGAGYASLQHVLHLQPDLIKLDMGLTRNIDIDLPRRALASALISFAREMGCRIIAEGVETASELATLRSLGVEKAQGYFLGRPMPLTDIATMINGPEALPPHAA